MKLKFKIQDFQTNAVQAAVDIFKGQEINQSVFTIEDNQLNFINNNLGYGNILTITQEQMLKNMNEVQERHLIPKTNDLEDNQFSIEMETGTGKTYVYIKTIFELNKHYGFTKFIIVVPSIATREGVYKSFQITEEHFKKYYYNVPYKYFIYNSSKLSSVRDFASNTDIEIMIINIDAFKKSENIINQEHDKLNGEKAINFIKGTNPIIIIDEPQSVDNTDKAKEAIASLNPLVIFRYSATHREKTNMIYSLTPVDAYQMKLVKQICVSSNEAIDDFNNPYIKFTSLNYENGFSAKLELDIKGKNGKIKRTARLLKQGDDLFTVSGERELYQGYIISNIDYTQDNEHIEFTNQKKLYLGESIGNIPDDIIKKTMIKRTIETHLDKELRYLDKGIKVLSLFFIDEVKKYRDYSNEEDTRGIYAKMFEECYNELINLEKYKSLKEIFPFLCNKVHDGYFSQDKKGHYKNTKGDSLDDYSTYNTIMKDKEWLLSFECPLRFIFSHSALKEGWDNQNIFQICTLIEQKSIFTCRQKVGRGLRLCVNQDGERVEDENINILHIIATETFSEFASTLQKEIEEDTGIKFGTVDIKMFSGIVYNVTKTVEKKSTKEEAEELIQNFKNKGYIDDTGKATEELKKAFIKNEIEIPKKLEPLKEKIKTVVDNTDNICETHINTDLLTDVNYTVQITEKKEVSYSEAQELMNHFVEKDYITQKGKIKDTMKNALKYGTLDLPEKFEAAREKFENIIKKADSKPIVTNAENQVIVKLKKSMLMKPEFEELWNKIKYKTTYRVIFSDEELIKKCADAIKEMPYIPKTRIVTNTSRFDIKSSGVFYTEQSLKSMEIDEIQNRLPNILRILRDECKIPKRVILEILKKSGRIYEFPNNPQYFIDEVRSIILDVKAELMIDGITYERLDGEEYYVQEIFDNKELIGYIDKNAVKVENSVYDYIIYDSETVEKPFAVSLDNDPDVKMYFKLPKNFKIQTPVGTYNPDWAVYFDDGKREKLYLVLETKGTIKLDNLRNIEKYKIKCGKRHFSCLENGTELKIAKDWNEFKIHQI